MEQIFFGGTIVTMEQPLYAEAVLVKNGLIRAVGKLEELIELAPQASRVDLHGHTMLPAFVDAHSHFSQVANTFLQVSLQDAGNRSDVRRRIQRFIRENSVPEGQWVTACGYDPTAFPDTQRLTREFLDDCAQGHPMLVQHQSGHAGLFNSLALLRLELTPQTPSPAGGKIQQHDGVLTGYLEENAYFAYQKRIPLPDIKDFLSAYVKAQKTYASYGITTVQEGLLVPEMFPLYRALIGARLLKLDVVGYPSADCIAQARRVFAAHMHTYSRHFKVGGVKIFLDGSPQARTAWMRTPYQNSEECGYPTMTDQAVLDALHTAARDKLQLLAHCNGDAAAAQFLRCVERTERACPDFSALRPVMIHAQLLGLDELDDVKKCGILPSFFVAHVWHWGDVHIQNFGMERAQTISPAAQALEHGIRFTFHQDAPVVAPNMLETVWCAVRRKTKSGETLGQPISVLEALKAVTVHAAYQYFEENEKGSICAGKHADFVILDQNPLDVPVDALRTVSVLQTIKNGAVLYTAP